MELFKGQDFSKIRKDQFDTGVPWTDPTFPPENTSIGHSKSSKLPRVVKWLRPSVSFWGDPRWAICCCGGTENR